VKEKGELFAPMPYINNNQHLFKKVIHRERRNFPINNFKKEKASASPALLSLPKF
jgi:hypothetical protein